jgi:nucleoside-diphosphate-sugar epimerase
MSDNKKESVLVTGANGFVGSRLCRRLLNEHYHVIAGMREGCNRELLTGMDLETRYGDVTCPETLPAMVEGVDYVVHNAGIVKAKKPDLFFKVNHFGTKNIAEACLQSLNLKKFIYISSLAAVGPSDGIKPLTEDDTPNPLTAYGRSKLAGEESILALKGRLNAVILRPPAIYGPGDREMFSFFKIVNLGMKPYLGNLSRRLQLIHVDDFCLGVFRTLRAETKPGAIYFISESKSFSYRELVHFLGLAVGRKTLPLYIPGSLLKGIARISEGFLKVLGKSSMFTAGKAEEILGSWEISTDKAKRELGFESKYLFPEGAAKTAEWYFKEGWL